jgi:hypothetical protein
MAQAIPLSACPWNDALPPRGYVTAAIEKCIIEQNDYGAIPASPNQHSRI